MQQNGDGGGPPTDKLHSQQPPEPQGDGNLSQNSFSEGPGNHFDEKSLLLENRPLAIRDIKEKINQNSADEYLAEFDMSELKSICQGILDEDKFDIKCFQTDRALVYFDHLRTISQSAFEDQDLVRVYEYSQDLYQVIYPRKDKIFSYDSERGNEQDLIDLLLATEIVSYSVLSIGLKPNEIDNQQQELTNSVEKLINKFSNLTLSSKFLDQNKIVSKFVTQRGETALIQSMQELVCQTIDNHQVMRQINEEQCQDTFHAIEAILARVTSLPVGNFNTFANHLVVKLVVNTDTEYHKNLIKSFFELMGSLYDEKKRGKLESFKNRILYKVSYILTLIMYKTTDGGKIAIMQEVNEQFNQGKRNEMIYIFFQAIDGEKMRVKGMEKFSFQKVVVGVIVNVIDKLDAHVKENKEKIEKSSSIKSLVLLFKPLEECLKIVGPLNQLLPEGYRKRIHGVLNNLKKMFPVDKAPDCQVPYSLMDSYYNLKLLIDTEYQKTAKIDFANYYTLFNIFENQVDKNEQNALIMCKLIILQNKTQVPEPDKKHFYAQFGKTVQKLLMIKESNVFFNILTSFIEWATHTELTDLNFILPNDPVVQNLLQSIMQTQKIENIPNLKNFDFNQKMVNLNEENYQLSMKDADIITKFCGKPAQIFEKNEETNDHSEHDIDNSRVDVFQKKEVPALDPNNLSDQDKKLFGIAQKLIDVELMSREDDEEEEQTAQKYTPEQIKQIAIKMLSGYKRESNDPTVKEFKAYLSKNKNSY